MSKQEELDQEELEQKEGNKEEEGEETSSGKFGKMGKIFLLIGIVLAQAAGAYGIINTYYPEVKDFTSSFESKGGVYFEFKNIIVNPAESNGERYLILSLTVELNDGGTLGTLDKKNAEVQDRINTAISQRTARELSSLDNRDAIKKELGIVINDVIGEKSVRNLFFTKYVLQ
jgi:flagellar FliL protein